MSRAPDPHPAAVRQRRPEPLRGRKGVPKFVLAIAALCIATLILIPVAKQKGWFSRQRPVDGPPTVTGYIPGLTVSESTVDPASRTVKGVVTNETDKTMDDVEISYEVHAGLPQVGLLIARIPQLGPHQKAKFETNPMPRNGWEPVLREVTGNPR